MILIQGVGRKVIFIYTSLFTHPNCYAQLLWAGYSHPQEQQVGLFVESKFWAITSLDSIPVPVSCTPSPPVLHCILFIAVTEVLAQRWRESPLPHTSHVTTSLKFLPFPLTCAFWVIVLLVPMISPSLGFHLTAETDFCAPFHASVYRMFSE